MSLEKSFVRMQRIVVAVCLIVFGCFAAVRAQTSVFTYQGRLTDTNIAASGTYQMQFSLFDALSGGTQQGSTILNNSVTVSNGIFTVQLDFTAAPLAAGADRWLEINVKKPADPAFITLTPRQQLTSSPFASRSSSAANADNAAQLGGLTANTYLQTNGNGSGLTNLNGTNITSNTINASALASDTFPNNQKLSRLGSLRWDLLGQRVAVGTNPFGVAFDGANIWVTNGGGNNVTKLRASDGACVGTCTFTVGNSPHGVAFDGANIWVVNASDNSVTKLRASDGACVGTCTFGVANTPSGIAFDGANMWVANFSGNTVTKLRASDGAFQGTSAVGTSPVGVAFDGENIWVTNAGSNTVTELQASDGAFQGTFSVGMNPSGIAFDGENMWVTNAGGNTVTKLRLDGFLQGTFSVGTNPRGIAFDGANIWVTNFGTSGSNTVTKLRASDGTVLGTHVVGAKPLGIVFDGANMWVANSLSNNVTKLPVFP